MVPEGVTRAAHCRKVRVEASMVVGPGLVGSGAAEKKVREPNIQYARKCIGAQRRLAVRNTNTVERVDVFGQPSMRSVGFSGA